MQNITIVTVCDNHFSVMLAALMKSLDLHHKSEEHIDFHIVSDGIRFYNKRKLITCVNPDRITIHWHNILEVIPKGTRLPLDKTSYPLNMYARLFIPKFLSLDVKRAIYMDVDMIVRKEISDLWYTDLNGKSIAGVVDQLKIVGGEQWTAIKNYKQLGFDANDKYFNSGLIIMDLDKWREKNITEQIFSTIEKNKDYVSFPDQYGLNVVFINEWHELSHKWNAFANLDEKDPAVIHFIMVKPIYKTYNLNQEYKDLFYHYLNMTPWKGYKQRSKFRSYFQKAKNTLQKKIKGFFRS